MSVSKFYIYVSLLVSITSCQFDEETGVSLSKPAVVGETGNESSDDSGLCDTSKLIPLESGKYILQGKSSTTIEIKRLADNCSMNYMINLQSDGFYSHKDLNVPQNGDAITVTAKACIPTPCAPPPPDVQNYKCEPYCFNYQYTLEIISKDEFTVSSDIQDLEGTYLK